MTASRSTLKSKWINVDYNYFLDVNLIMKSGFKSNLNKASRYEVLSRNQKYLPAITCRLCTNDWLEDVWTGRVQVPQTIDVRALNCKYYSAIDDSGATPPPANYIMEALQKALNDKGIQLDVITRRPDNKWALGVLSTLVSRIIVDVVVANK